MSDGNLKVPSQIFRWFEKMKNNYENNVQLVLRQFESFTCAQQERVDKVNNEHVNNLKLLHNQQNEQNKETVLHLKQEIEYYKQQVFQQHKTIEQLNSRYDTMISCLLTDKHKKIDFKDIFSEDDFYENTSEKINANRQELNQTLVQNIEENLNVDSTTDCKKEPDLWLNHLESEIFEQAIIHRKRGELEQAFTLFEQAAKQGYSKAMGAMGRSYFLGEGITEDQVLGLAWLIKAAKQKLPQAISRVEQFKGQQPELYQQALQYEMNL